MEIQHTKLIIKQKVEMLEAITGIETKNKYNILTESESEFGYAYEESNFFARTLLKQLRPLKLHILSKSQTKELLLEKKFAFFFAEYKLFNAKTNDKLGSVQTRFVWLGSKIDVKDKSGQDKFIIKSTLKHPWTFKIYNPKNLNEGSELGVIFKKWVGFGKELFTDADKFEVNFDKITNKEDKELILAAAFIIDLNIFERR